MNAGEHILYECALWVYQLERMREMHEKTDQRIQQFLAWCNSHENCTHKRMSVSAMRDCDHGRAIRIENAKRIYNAIMNQGTAGKGLALRPFNLRRI